MSSYKAPENPQKETTKTNHLANGAIIVTSTAGAPLVFVGIVKAAGFTAVGIAKSSVGATLMSKAAIMSGGTISAGSPVAIFQSIGALGLGSPVVLPLAVIGGTTAVTILYGPKIVSSVRDVANSGVVQDNVGYAYRKVTSTASNAVSGLKIEFFRSKL